ncbi:hypothetical protein [Methylobacterium aquaticum]|uniref:Uncharacterized protein n=1 Tax=Methylobacterium aquaticum TaxID=270351 RepID=A0A0C6FP38_9HYPH|nr:hypothetical protein [Methylobacterium aquaticum]BAQ44385.1 hypothetical protein Maq22A_c04920 [Methylobacterium aquaticum]
MITTYTMKKNAVRAARRLGLDADRVAQDTDGAWYVIEAVPVAPIAAVEGPALLDAHIHEHRDQELLAFAAASRARAAAEAIAALPAGTAAVYRALLASTEGGEEIDTQGRRWGAAYLDNARLAGMSAHTFAACLSVLAGAGLYRVLDGDAFGLVYLTGMDIAAPIGIKAGPGQFDDHCVLRVIRGEGFHAHIEALADARRNALDAEERVVTGMREYIDTLRTKGHKPGHRVMGDRAKPRTKAEEAAGPAPKEPRGKSAALIAAVRDLDGLTNSDIRRLTGWTKLGGFFTSCERAGLVLHRCREGADTRWFGVPAGEGGVRAYVQADGRWIAFGHYDDADDAVRAAAAEARSEDPTCTYTVGKKGEVYLFPIGAAAEAQAA